MYILSLVGTILYYVYFCRSGDCYYNIIFVTVNLLACCLFTLVSISSKVQEFNPRIGLLQSGVVTLYATYLVGSSLLSVPEIECNPYAGIPDSAVTYIVAAVGAIFTIVAVCYSTVRAATSSEQFTSGGEGGAGGAGGSEGAGDTQALLEASGAGEGEHHHDGDEADDEAHATTYNHSFFHLTFALAAMYIGELLTDWSSVSKLTYSTLDVDYGWVSVWVKMVSSWLAIILYCWTIVAPFLVPDREWD